MYKVVIVEDDHMISMLNRSFTERDSRFQVEKEFGSGRKALHWLAENPVDLILLDVYMPLMTGVEFLRQLRQLGSCTDVIVVTAAHETETLQALRMLGIVDYLIKPFTPERFQQALESFCQLRNALVGKECVCQSDVDKLMHQAMQKMDIPKGLQEKTLEKIRLELSLTTGQTCDTVACHVGVSAVTARRYLNFLLERGEADSGINYDTGGRPCMVYHAKITRNHSDAT